MSKTVRKLKGYIVSTRYGAQGLGVYAEDSESLEVLWLNTPVTLFPTRRAARNAIRRTLNYAKGMNYGDAWSGHFISEVRSDH